MRAGSTMAFAVIVAGLPLSAATVSVTAFADPNVQLVSGTNVCAQTDPIASCSIDAQFMDPRGLFNVRTLLSATAQFGSADASLDAGVFRSGVTTGYLSYFSNFVTITGGAGTGSFVTHFTLTASGLDMGFQEIGALPPFAPKFRIVQDPVITAPVLTLPFDGFPVSMSVEVTSAFEFGVPFWFGAGTEIDTRGPYFVIAGGDNWFSSSSVTLTAYSVFDAQGNLVPNAVVTPSQTEGPNVFIPEPATWRLLLIPLVLAARAGRIRCAALHLRGP